MMKYLQQYLHAFLLNLFVALLLLFLACQVAQAAPSQENVPHLAMAAQQVDSPTQAEGTNAATPATNRQEQGINTLVSKRIKVNMYINSIRNVDDQLGSYEVDFWLDLLQDQTLAGKTIEDVDTNTLWTPKLELVNARSVSTLFEGFDNSLEADTNLRLTKRLVANFFTTFNLRRFPFDQQTFVLTFESSEFDSTQVLFDFIVFEQPPAHSEQPLIQPVPLSKYFSNDTQLEGWILNNSQVVQQIRLLPYDKSSWSQFRFEITATRIYAPYLWKIVLILFFLMFFVWGVFWLDVTELRYRLLLLCTLLLSTATLDYKMVQILPQTAYLTVLDIYIAMCYGMLVAASLVVLLTKALAENSYLTWSTRLNRAMLIVYPIAALIVNLVLFWYALS